MTGAIEKLTLYTPIMASSGIFAARRFNKGIDAMDDNPLFGAANVLIAGGQTLKGLQAAGGLNNNVFALDKIKAANNSAKGLSLTSKIVKSTGKVLETVSRNVNAFIIGASAIKVLSSDDKEDTFKRELVRDVTMLGIFEGAAKNLFGIPKLVKNAEGKFVSEARPALYKKIPYLNDLGEKFVRYCKKTEMKSVPGVVKGLALVLFSITGYKVGDKLAEKMFGKEKCVTTNNEDKGAAHPIPATQTVALHG